MPTCQYIHNGLTDTFTILTPKSITSMWHWYKACYKACTRVPIIPKGQVTNEDGWMIEYQEATVRWIKFDLVNREGRKAYIVILR